MTNQQVRITFMQSPLVTWVRTLLEEDCSDYSELCNGQFLQKAWQKIDPQAPCLQSSEVTSLSRIKSLCSLLVHIRAFYENVLDQVLLIRLPDVINIALNATDDPSLVALGPTAEPSPHNGLISSYCAASHTDDLQTFLLLLLGCAVQCEQKELFIEKIKQLDISTQHAIVECIQQITDNPESVFLVSEWTSPPEEPAEKDRLYSTFVGHLGSLTKERDQLHQRVVDLSCELLNLSLSGSPMLTSAHSASLRNLSLSNSSLNTSFNGGAGHSHCDSKSHYLVELAELKSRLRRTQQELEEKSEVVVELKEVVEQNKEFCNKLRHENLELTQEARTAKAYRDEIDILNERVRKIDRLETEVTKYRDKMNELEFYKSRVEELREDARIVGETKTMLEEQLESSRRRTEKLPELEEKILKLNAYGNELNLQRELDRGQMERLIEDLAHMRQEKKQATDELARVQLELTDLRTQMHLDREGGRPVKSEAEEGNLLEQIKADTSKRILKLEFENQKLANLLDDYRNNYVDMDSLSSLLDFYPTKDGSTGSEGHSETGSTDSGFTSNKSKAEKLSELKEYIEKLKTTQTAAKTLENVKGELEKEVTGLKGRLHDEYNKTETMERQYTASAAENGKLTRILESKTKKLAEVQSEMALLEAENGKLVANADSLKLSLKKLNDLESEMTNLEGEKHRLEQEKKSLDKEIARLKTSIDYKDGVIDENSSKLSTLELENRRLKKENEVTGGVAGKLKESEKENKDLLNLVSVQKSTLTTLQGDLVSEKLRAQKYAGQVEKTMEALAKLATEHELPEVAPITSGEGLSLAVATFLGKAMDKALVPKETTIQRLQSQVDDLRVANGDMQSLIERLRRQLHLPEDESADKFSLTSLNELQRKIVHLEEEGKSLKLELSCAKEASSEMATKLEHTECTLVSVNERNSGLQSENARLQVENSLLKSQNGSLERQTAELQSQLATIQESIERFKVRADEYELAQRSLMEDNESLQEIHQQLTSDYENLMENHSALKASVKTLKLTNSRLEEERQTMAAKQVALLRQTDAELATLKERLAKECTEDVTLTERVATLLEENKSLNGEHQQLQHEHKMLQNIYKKLRSENNALTLKHTELQGETAELKDRMNGLYVEVSKLSSYCEMVALTNNTLETQRKRLATQSASLLSQYNDLLLELSSSGVNCEKSVVDKLRELCLKKERLEKMFHEYDINIEKSMPRVRGTAGGKGGPGAGHGPSLDDQIYGRLWEAETPPLSSHGASNGLAGESSSLLNSTALLRQYSLTNNGTASHCFAEKEKHLSITPPRIPPRQHHHHLPSLSTAGRSPLNHPQHHSHSTVVNSHETVIELTGLGGVSSDKMSIAVSTTRSPGLSLSSSKPLSSAVEGQESTGVSGVGKPQISSPSLSSQPHSPHSPLISKAGSAISSTGSPSVTHSYFMRGAFKSNSVNYGNLMRRQGADQTGVGGGGGGSSSKLNGSLASRPSPQLFHMPTSRNLAAHLAGAAATSPVHRDRYPSALVGMHHPPSTPTHTHTASSVKSDSSASHDSEKETESAASAKLSSTNNNHVLVNGTTVSSSSSSITSTRSTRIHLLGNGPVTPMSMAGVTAIVDSLKAPVNGSSVLTAAKDALNNNGDVASNGSPPGAGTGGGNCTNGANDNSNNSNSIWYEYGCV